MCALLFSRICCDPSRTESCGDDRAAGCPSSFLPQGEGLSDNGAETEKEALLRGEERGGTLALSSEPPDQALPEPEEAQDLSPRQAGMECLVQHKEI